MFSHACLAERSYRSWNDEIIHEDIVSCDEPGGVGVYEDIMSVPSMKTKERAHRAEEAS